MSKSGTFSSLARRGFLPSVFMIGVVGMAAYDYRVSSGKKEISIDTQHVDTSLEVPQGITERSNELNFLTLPNESAQRSDRNGSVEYNSEELDGLLLDN